MITQPQTTEDEERALERSEPDAGSLGLRQHDTLWLVVGTTVITAATLLMGLWGSGGHLAPPLDDTFIHFQYARQLAAGHPFEYNTGDLPSSGDSAFIYPLLLAPAYLLGLDRVTFMAPLLYADVLGFAAHLLMVLLVYRLAMGLAGRGVALLTAWLVLFDGRLNWMFLTGMETGPYTAALVAFFWAWWRAIPNGRGGRLGLGLLVLAGSLAALLRTEGHILVSIACLLTLLYLWRSGGLAWRHVWLLVPVVIGLVPYAVNLALTGYWQFNTALSKSHWYVPYSPLYEKLSLTAGLAITAAKDIYLGLEIGRSPFPLFAAPIAVLGAALALRGVLSPESRVQSRYAPNPPLPLTQDSGLWTLDSPKGRFLHFLLIVTFVAGIGLAFLLPPLHFYRYHQPYDFIFCFYLAFGLVWLAELVAGVRRSTGDGVAPAGREVNGYGSRLLLLPVAAGVALLLLPQFVAFLFDFGNSARDIYYQQMNFSEWIRRYTPKDARIAVSDTGAHKYLSDRRTIDVIGLTTNSLRVAHFAGWGAVYDILARMPEAERPQYLLIHPNIALNEDESVRQGLLEPYYSITTQNPTITAGPTEMLYKINWDFTRLDPRQPYLVAAGKKMFDQLNVGDLADEERHAYRIMARLPSISEPKAIVTSASYEKKAPVLTDSGRRHTGWEEFSVRSAAGRPLTIAARARLNSDAGQRLLVLANGKEVGLWEVQNTRAGLWQEYEYTIPATFITGDATVVRIDSTFDPGGPGFASYRYWSYAP